MSTGSEKTIAKTRANLTQATEGGHRKDVATVAMTPTRTEISARHIMRNVLNASRKVILPGSVVSPPTVLIPNQNRGLSLVFKTPNSCAVS